MLHFGSLVSRSSSAVDIGESGMRDYSFWAGYSNFPAPMVYNKGQGELLRAKVQKNCVCSIAPVDG